VNEAAELEQTGKKDAVHCSSEFLEILTTAKAHDIRSRRHAAAGVCVCVCVCVCICIHVYIYACISRFIPRQDSSSSFIYSFTSSHLQNAKHTRNTSVSLSVSLSVSMSVSMSVSLSVSALNFLV